MFNEFSVPDWPHASNPHRPCLRKKVVRRLFMIVFAVLTITQTTGCNLNKLAFTDAWMLSYRDSVWSKRAFNLNYANCDQPYAEDFEAGFCAGYQDVACGGDGYVPAMPPADYRSFEYQSPEGAQCVNAWFEGYPAGVAAARKDDVGTYHNVLISRMINAAVTQSETDQKLPSDVPIISPDLARGAAPTNRPVYTAPPVPPTQPASTTTPVAFPRSQPGMRAPVIVPNGPMPMPSTPESIPVTTAPENSETVIGNAQTEAQVATADALPPIVTGSGVMPEQLTEPTPTAMRPAYSGSNRRSR